MTYVGKVLIKRPFGGEVKVNLRFEFGKLRYGIIAAEFMVFPVFKKFGVIGIGTETVEGQRLLAQIVITADATSVTL